MGVKIYMRRTQILNAAAVKRTTFQEAKSAFMRHCKLRNLRPQTLRYYDEDLSYFHSRVPLRYVDAITQEVCENFLVEELESGKRVSSLNSRIRGLRVQEILGHTNASTTLNFYVKSDLSQMQAATNKLAAAFNL